MNGVGIDVGRVVGAEVGQGKVRLLWKEKNVGAWYREGRMGPECQLNSLARCGLSGEERR